MELCTAASIYLTTGLSQFLKTKNHTHFAAVDEHIHGCAGIHFYMGGQTQRLLVSESVQEWATVLKSNAAHDAFYVLRKKHDLVFSSPDIVYLNSGEDYIAVVFPKKVEYWKYTGSKHLQDNRIKLDFEKAGEGQIIPNKLAQVDYAALKKDLAQLFNAAIESYQNFRQIYADEDSVDYAIGVKMFQAALKQLDQSQQTIELLCNLNQLDANAAQIFHSLRSIETVHRMGTFLDTHRVAAEHAQLIENIYVLYQQTVNAKIQTTA